MQSIATLTMNPSLDLAAEVDRLLPEQKLRSHTSRYYPGGGGINVARVLRRFNTTALAVFPAGGAIGDKLKALLGEEQIAYKAVPVAEESRENFLVFVNETGKLYHFVMPGPRLTAEETQRCLMMLEQLNPAPDYLVASGSLPAGVDDEFFARVAHLAHRRGMRLILDTSGAPLAAILDKGVHLIRCNRREFADLTGEALAEDEAYRRKQLKEVVALNGMDALVVALGAGGAILTTYGEQIYVRSPPVKALSPVGAGDSFVALLALSLARGLPLHQVLCFAVAAAAAAVMTPGTELCRKEDVERLYQQMLGDKDAVQVYTDS